ncbi:MAG TPA: hypothetical protein VMV69_19195, partial [Pirellulales bacterium]|nr:hypothetical protein [Pirellulales bacterium]
RSTIRLPDIRRPAPGAAVAAHAVPAPTAPRASRWAEAADTNSPIKEATDPAGVSGNADFYYSQWTWRF